MSVPRVLRYIWRHVSQIMTGFFVLSLAALTFIPPLHEFTRHVFATAWQLVRSDAYSWALPLAFLMLLLGVWLNNTLEKRKYRWLEWSAYSRDSEPENVVYKPIRLKRLGWPYLVVLVFCMPFLAYGEELIFRELATNHLGMWVMLLVSGPIFGVVHIVSGVSVRMTVYYSLVGLIMAWVYLATGLAGVFALHASYNIIAITWVTFELRVRRPLGRALKRYAATRRHLPTVTAWLLKPQTAAIH